MKVPCIIVDDDPVYGKAISSYVKSIDKLDLRAVYTDTIKASEHLKDEVISVIFLDMELQETTGLDYIRSLENPPFVIFITSYPGYALESYDVQAIDYIIKPVNELRFKRAVDKALNIIETQRKANFSDSLLEEIRAGEDYFVVRSESQFIKVKYAEVLFIEAMGDFVKIHTPNAIHIALVNLKSVENVMPKELFIRTHRSFIVNVKHLSAISGFEVMTGGKSIPLSESFKDAVTEIFLGDKLIKRSS